MKKAISFILVFLLNTFSFQLVSSSTALNQTLDLLNIASQLSSLETGDDFELPLEDVEEKSGNNQNAEEEEKHFAFTFDCKSSCDSQKLQYLSQYQDFTEIHFEIQIPPPELV